MAGVQISTLIECWRTDGRTMAGATDVACEVVFWVAALDVIHVSSLCLCGGEQCVRPGRCSWPCQQEGGGTASSTMGSNTMRCSGNSISIAGHFLSILGQEAMCRDKVDGDNACVLPPGGHAGSRVITGARRADRWTVRSVRRAAGSGRASDLDDGEAHEPTPNLPSSFRLVRMGPAAAALSRYWAAQSEGVLPNWPRNQREKSPAVKESLQVRQLHTTCVCRWPDTPRRVQHVPH